MHAPCVLCFCTLLLYFDLVFGLVWFSVWFGLVDVDVYAVLHRIVLYGFVLNCVVLYCILFN